MEDRAKERGRTLLTPAVDDGVYRASPYPLSPSRQVR